MVGEPVDRHFIVPDSQQLCLSPLYSQASCTLGDKNGFPAFMTIRERKYLRFVYRRVGSSSAYLHDHSIN